MKKAISLAVAAGVLVSAGLYFMKKNPEVFDRIINNVLSQMGM
ncbi:MAG: hypothetical protein N4A68_11775 [Maledivibacter sp.]|nr:hypothetical protein [Maledivibacter sp.]